MKIYSKVSKELIEIVKSGGVGVIPTDTIYGLVGSAFNESTIDRIYNLKKRKSNKPFIVLISSIGDLKKFGLSQKDKNLSFLLKSVWPGPVSVILPINCGFKYIHRGSNSIAFRLPKTLWLKKLLNKTGPLVAPSANLSGKRPVQSIKEAEKNFGNKIDFCLDKKTSKSDPSMVLKVLRY